MIDILKGLIDLLLRSIHTIFFIEIPLYNDHTIHLGMLILAIAFIIISIILICEVTGLKFFKGDDD